MLPKSYDTLPPTLHTLERRRLLADRQGRQVEGRARLSGVLVEGSRPSPFCAAINMEKEEEKKKKKTGPSVKPPKAES
jgi:hypothetical protein